MSRKDCTSTFSPVRIPYILDIPYARSSEATIAIRDSGQLARIGLVLRHETRNACAGDIQALQAAKVRKLHHARLEGRISRQVTFVRDQLVIGQRAGRMGEHCPDFLIDSVADWHRVS